MLDQTLRLLKLERGDLGRVSLFAALSFLLQAGLSIGMSAGDAVFLAGAGAANLPYVYIATAGALQFYTPLMASVSGRFGADGALLLALAILVPGGVAIWAGIDRMAALPAWAGDLLHYGVRLYAAVWFIGLYTLFWNFADDYFDVQDGKRLFAMFSAGAALGGIAGGILVSQIAGLLPVAALYLLWSGLALLTIPLVLHIRTRWRRLQEGEDEADTRGSLVTAWEGVRAAPYVPLVTGVFLLSLLLGNLNEFQYLSIFAQGRSEDELARLFGQLYGAASALTLVINLFLFNRLVLRLGVRSVALLVPLTYVALFTYYFGDFGLLPALAGFLLLQGIVPAIDFNNFNFLFNAIDERYRKQVRTLVEGLCEPFVTCIAGLALLLVHQNLSAEQLSAIGLLIALALVLLVLVLRGSYREAMVRNLRRGWLDFGGRPGEVRGGADLAELERLAGNRAIPDDIRATALAMLVGNHAPREDDLALLLGFIDDAGPAGQVEARRILRRALAAGAGRSLLRLADDPSRAALWDRPAMVAELGAHRLLDQGRIEALEERLGEREMVAAAVIALWNSSDPIHCRMALDRLTHLRVGDEGERLAGVQALGRLGEERFAHLVTEFLTDAAPEVRHGALVALKEMGPLRTMHLVDHILAAIRKASPAARSVGIEVLASSGDPTVLMPLLDLADLLTPFERRVMEQAASGMGAAAIPNLVSALRNQRLGFASRAVAARALARLSPAQFAATTRELPAKELHRAYEAERNSFLVPELAGSVGAVVLRRFYQDLERDCLEFALLLLTLNGGLPNFELLIVSLGSDNAKARGNALEALEQGADYDVFTLIRGLTDRSAQQERQIELRRQAVAADPADRFRAALAADVPLEAAAAAQALFDLDAQAALPALRPRLHAGGTDLAQQTVLDLLSLESSTQRMTPVARLAALAECPLFQSSPLRDLLTIVGASEQCEIEDTALFEPGERADSLFLILRGAVTLTGNGDTAMRLEAPDLVGLEALSATHYAGEAHMAEGEVLVIPAQAVLEAAKAYPRLAMRLFEMRVAA